jgi:NAD(P)-dependent dehydrogenase (short-subunit alcohol dehydrogenase family)
MLEPKKIALVTGATRGIGLETVRQLAGHGLKVLLSGRDTAAVIDRVSAMRAADLDVDPQSLDVTSCESVAAAATEIEQRFGRLDVLVNNAGIRIEEYGKLPSEQTLAEWRETFETNLFGPVMVTNAFLPLLRKSPAARIVNVSSLLGSLATHCDRDSYAYSDKFKSLPGYSSAKSALNSWTVHLAYELRDTRIKVNSAHPGYTKTDMNEGDGDLDITAGAATSVRLALLDDNGPTGGFYHFYETVPW